MDNETKTGERYESKPYWKQEWRQLTPVPEIGRAHAKQYSHEGWQNAYNRHEAEPNQPSY